MDVMAILRQLDIERQTVADSDVRLERTPFVVRAIGVGTWSGVVYSRFSASETEAIVQGEIEYFTRSARAFEWKIYGLAHAVAQLRLQHRRGRIANGLRFGTVITSVSSGAARGGGDHPGAR